MKPDGGENLPLAAGRLERQERPVNAHVHTVGDAEPFGGAQARQHLVCQRFDRHASASGLQRRAREAQRPLETFDSGMVAAAAWRAGTMGIARSLSSMPR